MKPRSTGSAATHILQHSHRGCAVTLAWCRHLVPRGCGSTAAITSSARPMRPLLFAGASRFASPSLGSFDPGRSGTRLVHSLIPLVQALHRGGPQHLRPFQSLRRRWALIFPLGTAQFDKPRAGEACWLSYRFQPDNHGSLKPYTKLNPTHLQPASAPYPSILPARPSLSEVFAI